MTVDTAEEVEDVGTTMMNEEAVGQCYEKHLNELVEVDWNKFEQISAGNPRRKEDELVFSSS